MKSHDHRWDELQNRWAKGESLSEDEQHERLALAAVDALAQRELEVFAEMRARGTAPEEPVPYVLIGRALEAINASQRLRLVTTFSEGAPERRHAKR